MICHFLLRRQRLCFAVARIFVRCLTYPKAVRESIRRILRYSLLLVVPPERRALALVSELLRKASFRSALGTVEASLLYFI